MHLILSPISASFVLQAKAPYMEGMHDFSHEIMISVAHLSKLLNLRSILGVQVFVVYTFF